MNCEFRVDFQQILTKICFVVLCAKVLQIIFTNAKRVLNIMCVSFSAKKKNEQGMLITRPKKQSKSLFELTLIVALLIISAVLTYFQGGF